MREEINGVVYRDGKIVNCSKNWVELPIWKIAYLWHWYPSLAKEYLSWLGEILYALGHSILALTVFCIAVILFPVMPFVRAIQYRFRGLRERRSLK